jgi:intracellular sulfur oxidation DsrE/DsrF family protein
MGQEIAGAVLTLLLCGKLAAAATLPPPSAPVIPQAYGFVPVPGAAVKPDKHRFYRAIFSATAAADKPDALLPAVLMAGTELNTLVASGVPLAHADYIIDFHGRGAVYGLLDNAQYRQKFGIDNPNLPVLAELKKSGVRLYVCSQQMLAMGLSFDSISPDVTVASDGLFLLINFQNQGYAYLPF